MFGCLHVGASFEQRRGQSYGQFTAVERCELQFATGDLFGRIAPHEQCQGVLGGAYAVLESRHECCGGGEFHLRLAVGGLVCQASFEAQLRHAHAFFASAFCAAYYVEFVVERYELVVKACHFGNKRHACGAFVEHCGHV